MISRINRFKRRYGKWAISIALFFCFTSLSCAMGTGGEKQTTVDSKQASASKKSTLAEILSNAKYYDTRMVKVAGVFKGWKGRCASSFSLTRSDWILSDGTECIYVSGILPPGVSAVRPNDERLEVTAKVIVAANGKVNLKAKEIKVRQTGEGTP